MTPRSSEGMRPSDGSPPPRSPRSLPATELPHLPNATEAQSSGRQSTTEPPQQSDEVSSEKVNEMRERVTSGRGGNRATSETALRSHSNAPSFTLSSPPSCLIDELTQSSPRQSTQALMERSKLGYLRTRNRAESASSAPFERSTPPKWHSLGRRSPLSHHVAPSASAASLSSLTSLTSLPSSQPASTSPTSPHTYPLPHPSSLATLISAATSTTLKDKTQPSLTYPNRNTGRSPSSSYRQVQVSNSPVSMGEASGSGPAVPHPLPRGASVASLTIGAPPPGATGSRYPLNRHDSGSSCSIRRPSPVSCGELQVSPSPTLSLVMPRPGCSLSRRTVAAASPPPPQKSELSRPRSTSQVGMREMKRDRSAVSRQRVVELGGKPTSPGARGASHRKASVDKRTTAVGDVGVKYLSEEELEPLPTTPSDRDLHKIAALLGSDDWKVQFETLDTVRRIAQFHPHCITTATFTEIARAVIKNVDSLRSSIAKNALMCVHDVWFYFSDNEALKRSQELMISDCVSLVIKRAADISNTFISEEADKTLDCLCIRGSYNGIISFLNRDVIAHSKNGTRKAKAARCYAVLARRLGKQLDSKVKEWVPMIKTLMALTTDANIDAKHLAKATLNEINSVYSWETEKLLSKSMSKSEVQKFRDASKKANDSGHMLDSLL
eukprot:GHVN01027674.1.p1 GENE.GHVN01027674.1~~GHVN01027674.1.p1  ORF type:complete len:740 (-),score=184.01 GHVN01027674.1:135-2135(-)